jgi:membrane-bound lytic murein transglycosylase D
MKKTSLTLSLLLVCASVFGQNPPTAPRSVGFGGMTVQFDDDARAIVQDDINALMVNKKYWEAKLDRCLMYLPIIETILIDEDLPTDFKFLAVQESSLQPDAASASNAVGFWQFKQETATDYGLRVDDQIDERKNINASTHAAAQYLKKNNLQFNNWVATLYSYYLGAGAIAKLIPIDWSYSKEIKLTGATDRYLLRFFAHKIALEAGLNRYTPAKPMILLEYTKGGGRTFGAVAKELDVDEASLRVFNKWATSNDIPSDKPYTLVVPVSGFEAQNVKAKIGVDSGSRRDNFTQSDIGFPALKRSQAGDGIGALLYEINGLPGIMAVNGDDAGSLARKAKMSFGSFLRHNDMSEADPIEAGQVYYLEKKSKKAVVPFHTVRDGETLWQISQIYGIRLRRLIRNNRIDNRNQRLQTGRILWLMEKRPRDKPVEVVEGAPDELFPNKNKNRSQPRPAAPEPKATDSGRNIPQKPTDRKVYTPKLAEKPKPAPTQTKPNDMGEEITTEEVTQKQNQPKTTEPEKPSRRAPSFNPSGNKSEATVSTKKPAVQEPKIEIKQPEEVVSVQKSVETAKPKTQEPITKNPVAATKPETTVPSPKSNAQNPASFTHTITHGQTYYSISKMYEVSVNDILAWNNLTLDSKLADGQKLIIKTIGKTAETQPQQPADEFIIHTVDAGEWLFRIAQKYGVKMAQIREWNNLTDDAVKVGQQLKIKKK